MRTLGYKIRIQWTDHMSDHIGVVVVIESFEKRRHAGFGLIWIVL